MLPTSAIHSAPSMESHNHVGLVVADVAGSAASGRDKTHCVEPNAVDCISVGGKHTCGDTIEIFVVTGLQVDDSVGETVSIQKLYCNTTWLMKYLLSKKRLTRSFIHFDR